ncbi:MAG: hypothetical protein HC934_04720 [Acaryochloridaceae cyanobacterium SU_2_1]|nr:hypothetical protein [Acaryochloridaceae cyanobacterium SU_2_1]
MRNRLLLLGAVCVAGTINTALFGGATGLTVGLASNIVATDLGSLWDKLAQRFKGRDAVLHNEDLSTAVGRAIAAVIARTARLEQYRDYQEPLWQLARRAEAEWAELSQLPEFAEEAGLDPLREENLAKFFAVKPAEFAEATALKPADWASLLNTWQQQEPEVERDPQVMKEVAEIFAS